MRILAAQILLEAEEKNFEEADKIWASALQKAQETSAGSWLWLELFDSRYAALKQAGRRYDALATCRLARAFFHDRGFTKGIVSARIGEAEVLHLMDDMVGAEEAAVRAIELSHDEATALLFWGYSIVWEKHPPQRYRTVIALGDKYWNEDWSNFEKFHVRLLQGLLYYYSLEEYEPALERFKQAEKLAGTTVRPSSGNSTILLSFHQFGDGYSSDMEKALWLQLIVLNDLGRDEEFVRNFMERKLPLLPSAEKAPWLYTLGRKVLHSSPKAAAAYFEESLEYASGDVRPKLLRAIAGVYRKTGWDSLAREKESELAGELLGLGAETQAALERFELYEAVHQIIRERAWSVWEGREFVVEPSMVLELLSEPSESQASLEKYKRERLEDGERQGYDSAVESSYTLRAAQLLYKGRLAEALALIRRARESAESGHFPVGSYRRVESLILGALGDTQGALEPARMERASLEKKDGVRDTSSLLRTLTLESTALLQAGEYDRALELVDRYADSLGEGDRLFQAAFRGIGLQALLGLNRPKEAILAAEELQRLFPEPAVRLHSKLILAEAYRRTGNLSGAVEELRTALELARSVGSPFAARIVRLWSEIDPSGAPVEETAKYLETLLSLEPRSVALRYQAQPEIASLLLATETKKKDATSGALTPREFIAKVKLLTLREPQMETSIPLLPSAFVEQAARLKPETALVQYYTGEKDSLIMAGTGDDFYLFPIGLGRAEIKSLSESLLSGSDRLLGRLLIEPVLERISSRNLILCTHGPLQGLRWDLLEVKGKPLPYSLSWEHWVGSGSPHLLPDLEKAKVLAIGGVPHARLPGTSREVQFVKGLAPERVTLLEGTAATQKRLNEELSGKDIVLIATHSDPEGLTLADGVLELPAIYNLPIKGGALVILSSCESGSVGDAERSPISLATAFLDAGAGAVLATLDKVDDLQTEAFVTSFYNYLSQGHDPREALRLAKVDASVVDKGGDWSKFVLYGSAGGGR